MLGLTVTHTHVRSTTYHIITITLKNKKLWQHFVHYRGQFSPADPQYQRQYVYHHHDEGKCPLKD